MAAVDFFLKFDGIKGESTDAKHKDEIDVESWSWGRRTPAAVAPAGAPEPARSRCRTSTSRCGRTRRASALMRACATGQHIKVATLTGRKAGKDQQEYLTFKFYDVLVSSFQTGGASRRRRPVDQVSLDFAKIEVEYRPQQRDGTLGTPVHFGFDLKQNKAR